MCRFDPIRQALFLVVLIMVCAPLATAFQPPAKVPSERLDLHAGWLIQAACRAEASPSTPAKCEPTGETISSASFHPQGWMPASVPTTVVAAQVAAGLIKDPFFGDNIRRLPGMDYPQGGLFSNMAMRESSPYNVGWWYRTQFRSPAHFAGRQVALHLDGVNYRADVWLNGRRLASKDDVAGTWRIFEFDVTRDLLAGGENTLAIEVFPPTENDLSMTWVDWNPDPPDKNTGLFRDVYLTASGPVALRFPFVATRLNDSFTSAQLTPTVEAWNTTSRPVKATLTWQLADKSVRQEVVLEGNEKKTVAFDPARFPELTIQNPRLWWPAELGAPTLYHARVLATVDGRLSEVQELQFGIRQVTSELQDGRLLFKVNGKPILIRGAGWSPDMLLRYSPQRMETEFTYVRDMGLNTIRLEGKLENQDFYDLADQYGIFVMAGWTCCSMWERWNEWGPEQYKTAEASQRDQLRLLRNHPSMLVWLNGSDNPPPANVEQMYLSVGHEAAWPNPFLSSASATPAPVTGPSGVKMTGPYDYVPPNYWLTDKGSYGGAWSFNTETSPGPAIPIPASMRKFLPADKLWPQNEMWAVHEGGERFQTIAAYNTSLEHRYGAPRDYADFMRKAYAMDYEGERAMFEAYARNKYVATGVIQWMLNNAWPALIWHLYDYYLQPAGGYFGTKKANEHMHVLYSYDNHSVAVVSDLQTSYVVAVYAKLFNLDGTEKWSQDAMVDVGPEKASLAFTVPQLPDLSTTYFLKLYATDRFSKVESNNFYWLSTKADELDWTATNDTVYTPQSAYADLTELQALPQVAVKVQTKSSPYVCGCSNCAKATASGPGHYPDSVLPPDAASCDSRLPDGQKVTLSNPGKAVAFMIHLRLIKEAEEDVTPALWDDNYISLLPGESRAVTVRYSSADLVRGQSHLLIDGWNVAPQEIALR